MLETAETDQPHPTRSDRVRFRPDVKVERDADGKRGWFLGFKASVSFERAMQFLFGRWAKKKSAPTNKTTKPNA